MDKILREIKTKSEADELSGALDLMLDSLFSVKKNGISGILKKSVNFKIAGNIAESIKDFGQDREKTRIFLTDLKAKLQSFKVLKLTLAFEPAENTLEKIKSSVQLNFGNEVILEIEYDPSVIGGAIINYDGIYKDYSLRKKLEETFNRKREEITSLLNC